MTTPFLGDDRNIFNIIPSLAISSNATTLAFIVAGAVVVLLTKGFHFKAKKTITNEYLKQRQMTFRLGKDPNSIPLPKFANDTELEAEDKKLIYNRLHDPSQFVFEGFAFKRPLTILLYIYRVILALWMVIMMCVDVAYFRPKPFLTYFSFLTNTSAFVFAMYYVLQSVFGLFYITTCYKFFNDSKKTGKAKRNVEELNVWVRKIFTFISTVIWLFAELNHVAATLVAFGYWIIVIPQYAINGKVTTDPDVLSYFTFGYHGLQMIFNLIEFLMSNVVFRIWHLFILMIYPTIYLIWIQTNMEARWVNIWPYDVIDYYRNPWFAIIVYSFGLFLVFCLSFFCYWLATTIRLKILTKRLKKIRFTRRNTQKMNALLKNSVAALVNTAIELDTIMDSPHQQYPTVVYTTGNTSIATANTVTPPSSLTSSPAALHPQLHHHRHEEEEEVVLDHEDMILSGSNPHNQRHHTPMGILSDHNVNEDLDVLDAPRGNKKTSDVVSKLVKLSKNQIPPNVVSSPASSTPSSTTNLIPTLNTTKLHHEGAHIGERHQGEEVLIAISEGHDDSRHGTTVITLSTPTPRTQAHSVNIEFI
ncbi:hypothetical protein C9374_003219 [Naegleria lovaniensis]|uniref:Uncharacterized protein n=1 Tax=Naegleria lovaniensis TaxID=51637 RepID=A0AA88GSJ6_NAELO|nr:uncharacterized protein C9374_003219 [Naegleria lovaniensis]KAG2386070.1 hypothetical protein C9374_003219 [Naegleria lovaniensis]